MLFLCMFFYRELKKIFLIFFIVDKSFEASAKLMKYTSSRECLYSYEWTYHTKQDQKQGKFSLKLAEKVGRKPGLVEVEVSYIEE